MLFRYDLINHFIASRGFRSFLEIGTAGGETFRAVNCERKVSVDPNAAATFRMTSDEFFHRNLFCFFSDFVIARSHTIFDGTNFIHLTNSPGFLRNCRASFDRNVIKWCALRKMFFKHQSEFLCL